MNTVIETPLNVAVLGCGMIVRRAHLPGLLSRSGAARVPVIFGPDTPNSHQLAYDFRIPKLVHSLDAVFNTVDLDAVVIALPNHLHAPAAFAAISSGLPILLEKPIASTIGMAREVVARAKQAGTRISMSLPHRQRSSVVHLKRLIEAGRFGEIQSIDIKMIRRAGIPDYGGWFTRRAMSGGGVLTDLGPHVLDTVLWLAGCSQVAEVDEVNSRMWSTHGPVQRGLGDWGRRRYGVEMDDRPFDVEDRAWLSINIKSGTQITAEVAWAVYGCNENRIRIVGDKGGADYWPESYGDCAPLRLFCDNADGRPAESVLAPVEADHDDLGPAWIKVAQTFVEDIATSQSRLVTGEDALVISEIIQHAYERKQ